MARTIQPSNAVKAGARTFLAPFGAAIFWLVIAFNFPYERIPDWVPEMAPYAAFLRPLFYLLAAWAFVRSFRALAQIARSMDRPRLRASRPPESSPTSHHKSGQRGVRQTNTGLTAPPRPPTIQRMR